MDSAMASGTCFLLSPDYFILTNTEEPDTEPQRKLPPGVRVCVCAYVCMCVCVRPADTLTSRVHAAEGPAQLLGLNAACRCQLAAPLQHQQQRRAVLLRV